MTFTRLNLGLVKYISRTLCPIVYHSFEVPNGHAMIRQMINQTRRMMKQCILSKRLLLKLLTVRNYYTAEMYTS